MARLFQNSTFNCRLTRIRKDIVKVSDAFARSADGTSIIWNVRACRTRRCSSCWTWCWISCRFRSFRNTTATFAFIIHKLRQVSTFSKRHEATMTCLFQNSALNCRLIRICEYCFEVGNTFTRSTDRTSVTRNVRASFIIQTSTHCFKAICFFLFFN